MATSHSNVSLRGLTHTPRSAGFTGSFGRLFPELRPAQFGANENENTNNLERLGAAMAGPADSPKDGKDDEESGIPALYTYFGQFIDHDLTFDPASSLQKQADPDALADFRSPTFDLDNLYGRGPDDQPYLYDDSGRTLLLGAKLLGGPKTAFDLPRNNAPTGRALIGDPRNDENSIVSQLQGLFQRFHNGIAKDASLTFEQVQQRVRFHYQHVVLYDFLARIVSADVLDALTTGDGAYDESKLKFVSFDDYPFMPVEFSVAAYRLGHSMVRPGYRLNDNVLQPIFGPGGAGLSGFKPMIPGWGIDWGRFIDIDRRATDGGDATKRKRLQFAYRIDTSLAHPLTALPGMSDGIISLPTRNLLRGWRIGLPSGQDVARRMGVTPLTDAEIVIGQALDKPDGPPVTIASLPAVFSGNCPLWTYILAEAMHHRSGVAIPVKEAGLTVQTPQLGPVGGRIVAEVFLGLAFADKSSVLAHPEWTPMSADFKLRDLVAFALAN